VRWFVSDRMPEVYQTCSEGVALCNQLCISDTNMHVPATVRVIIGVTLLLLGVAGLFLPILQGWLFLALGALVLSKDVPLFNRFYTWITRRFPKTVTLIEHFKRKLPRQT